MANTVTGLTPDAQIRVLEVARETSAMSRLVTNNYAAETAAYGETVRINVLNDFEAEAVTPGVVPPTNATNDITPVTNTLTLNQFFKSDFTLTSQEILKIAVGKSEAMDSAIRAVVNKINSTCTGLYKDVYNFVGTAGTTPFASNPGILKDSNTKLDLAAAPMEMRSLVLDPFGYNNATQLSVLQQVDSSGMTETLRDAIVRRAIGYDWAMDQKIATHTTTATGDYAIDAVGAVGDTTITVDNAAGALPTAMVVGDLFTIAGSTQQYTVTSYAAGSTEAVVGISPALDQIVADGDVVTEVVSHTANLAFHPQAFHLAVREEANVTARLAEMGVQSTQLRQTITDELSGLALTFTIYEGYHQTRMEVSALWGVVTARPEFAVRILG
jgi:hypothetical protein